VEAPAHSGVVIHVVAEQSTVEGTSSTPGVLPGFTGLIPAALSAELVKSAWLVPIRPCCGDRAQLRPQLLSSLAKRS
jgi:hypothetical protein